jgi:hypothetical protein
VPILNVDQSLRLPSSVDTEDRRDAAKQIASMAAAAGLSERAQAAMIVNSYYESGLIKDRVQPGVSVPGIGLFQLTSSDYTPHDAGYAPGTRIRKGTREQRKDPFHNISYILYEVMETGWGKRFRSLDERGASVGDLAYVFAQDIERCACCGDPHSNGRVIHNRNADDCTPRDKHAQDRREGAASLFPTLETGGPSMVPPAPSTAGRSRDVVGPGGWLYRQWPDGTIKIIDAPEGYRAGGLFAPNSPTNVAITNEIGPYPTSSGTAGLVIPVLIGVGIVGAILFNKGLMS